VRAQAGPQLKARQRKLAGTGLASARVADGMQELARLTRLANAAPDPANAELSGAGPCGARSPRAATGPSWTGCPGRPLSRSAASTTRRRWPRRPARTASEVIIGYLWGHPIAAITRRGLAHAAPRVRLVEVGQMADPTISLPADMLRSSGLEILGSGPGTIPLAEIVGAIPEFMAIAATGELPIDIDEVPLAEVEFAWQRHDDGRRIVLRP
jgi:hypothetical protein